MAQAFSPSVATRFLPVVPILLFLVSDVFHQVSVVQSTYLRAFKREPFVIVSTVLAGLVATGTFLLTPRMGVTGPAMSYLVAVIVGLAIATRIFVRARKDWTVPRG
jgi:O-antigen/teichoic acid export membrane protein